MTNPIPHGISAEIVGQFHFSTNPDRDLAIAENLAECSYLSITQLYNMCLANVDMKLRRKAPKLESFQTNPYFSPYFESNP